MVLIGNKYDLHATERALESSEVQSYAEDHGIFFIEISVKTKHNFDVLLCWLEEKTQEKFHKAIAMEEIVEEEVASDMMHNGGKKGKGRNGKRKGKSKKSLLKRHHTRGQTIQLDRVEMKENPKVKRACCSF